MAKINSEGVWIEALEQDPARFLPETTESDLSRNVVEVDLNQSMGRHPSQLTKYPVKTRLSLSGTLVVGRDIAHAKIKERLDAGEEMPEYLRESPIYYAGSRQDTRGLRIRCVRSNNSESHGSLCRSNSRQPWLHDHAAKGNRSQQVTDACRTHGGFYLGSIGGPAARLQGLDS